MKYDSVALLEHIAKLNADPNNEEVCDDLPTWHELGVYTPDELDAFIAPMP